MSLQGGLNVTEPLVSVLFLNCNRLKFLKNSVNSFLECNEYPNVEIVICDNGSTEPGTGEWLDSLKHPWIKHVLRMSDPSRIAVAKNRSRSLASGDYVLELNDDFQFICRGRWMDDLIDVANSSPPPLTVFYYATVARKLSSYELRAAKTPHGLPFFTVLNAGYHDVHFMKRSIWERVGPFSERTWQRGRLFGRAIPVPVGDSRDLSLGQRVRQMLLKPLLRWGRPSLEGCESEYITRTAKLGFGRGSRAMIKYPIAAPLAFPNLARFRDGRLIGYYPDCDCAPFYYDIISYEGLKEKYADRERPLGAEEICRVVGVKDYVGDLSQELHYL